MYFLNFTQMFLPTLICKLVLKIVFLWKQSLKWLLDHPLTHPEIFFVFLTKIEFRVDLLIVYFHAILNTYKIWNFKS